jgi:DNA-binding transcriptional MerR regulator
MAVMAGKQATTNREDAVPSRAESASRPRKALTIGAVAKILGQEFDDISISKIRYLEDQKLLAPRRTAGGDRLYSQADVERLRAILRMQRDEFLPLRVIRQELATGDFTGRRPSGEGQKRRAATGGGRRMGMLGIREGHQRERKVSLYFPICSSSPSRSCSDSMRLRFT